jgi:hypothetical protein
MGVFLNDKPYVWPADTLYPFNGDANYGHLWQSKVTEPADTARDWNAIRRCFALPVQFSQLPHGLIRYVCNYQSVSIENTDDLIYRDTIAILRK